MKIVNVIRLGIFVAMAGTAVVANADAARAARRHARFEQAIVNCENSELNTSKVELVPPAQVQQGQRPVFFPEQKALFHACRQAGIIPHFRHHHRHSQAQQGAV